MTQTDPFVLETVTGPKTLDEIQDALDALWVAHAAVPVPVRMHVAIATAEVGANIIEHAAAGKAIRMRMESRVRPDAVEVVFMDEGLAANVDLDAVTYPDEMAERGRGLALVKSVLSQLSYQRIGETNRWTLVSAPFS